MAVLGGLDFDGRPQLIGIKASAATNAMMERVLTSVPESRFGGHRTNHQGVAMRRITLLALLSALPHVAAAQNQWSMTCTDKAGRQSSASAVVTSQQGCATVVTGLPPTRRVDGTPLALSDIGYCTVTRLRSGSIEQTRIDAAPVLVHQYVDRAACCATTPPVTPPVTPPATLGAPQNFRVTGLTGSTGRVECTIAPGTDKVILFRVNRDNSIGSRLATGPACGFTYTKFGAGKYVLKAEDRQGKQSGRSNAITL